MTDVRIRVGFLHRFLLHSSLHFRQTQFFNDTAEPQLLQKVLQLRRLWYRKGLIHHRTVNGYIQPNGSQILAEQGVLPVYGQVFFQLSLHLICMIQDIFQSAVLLKQPGCRLGSNAGYPRNIIRFVPHQPFHINELKRCKAVFLFHFLLIVPMKYSDAFFGKQNIAIAGYQLKGVLIPGNQQNIPVRTAAGPGKGPQYVVRFIAIHFINGNVHLFHGFPGQLKLRNQLLRCFLPGALIGLVFPVSEGRRLFIKCHSQTVRLIIAYQFQQHI